MRRRLHSVLAGGLLTALGLTSAEIAGASFLSLIGVEATYCLATSQVEFEPAPCVVESFEIFECSVSTNPICITEQPYIEVTTVDGYVSEGASELHIAGTSWYSMGDIVFSGELEVSGFRVNSEIFAIDGSYRFDLNYFSECVATGACGHGEIALIRYAGDPAAFDGLVPKTVFDLVAFGLIDSSDILLVHNDFPGIPGQPSALAPFAFDVPVNGTRNDHLYLFATFQTPLPEPSGWVALLAGALALRGLARCKHSQRYL